MSHKNDFQQVNKLPKQSANTFLLLNFLLYFLANGNSSISTTTHNITLRKFHNFSPPHFFSFLCVKWKGQKLSFQRPYWICAICLDSKNTQNEWKKNPQISTLWTWLNKQQQVSACASTKQFGSIWGNTLPNLFVFFHAEQLQKISWLPLFLPRWWNHHLWT